MKIKTVIKQTVLTAAVAAAMGFSAMAAAGTPVAKYSTFKMRSANACVPYAVGYVTIEKLGFAELMQVEVKNLPPDTEFDFFVIQAPTNPFGMSWYQGDIKTDKWGRGYAKFIGRFNKETFIIGSGVAKAPVVHSDGKFPDAAENPATNPIHTFHLGLWFNSPDDARDAQCPDFETPFNGEHNAGIQVLNTAQFIYKGPLGYINP
jgi:hypothetical protein